MFSRHLIGQTFSIGASAAAILLCATPARSAPGKRAICTPALTAYKKAVEREKAGQLSEARELLQTCMQATVCGGLVPKCTAKYNELGTDTTTTPAPARAPAPASASPTSTERTHSTDHKRDPVDMCSVVPVVTDEAGEPRVDVQVRMDGALLVSHLDGKGLPVDPGVHEFTFSTDSGVFSTQKIMIVEGQRNRPISASLHSSDKGVHKTALAASAPPPQQAAPDKAAADASSAGETALQETAPAEAAPADRPKKGGRSPLVYALGGAGLLGVGAGVLMTYWGVKDNESLSQCSPNCPQSSVDHIRTLYLASDISAGVGVAALGVATWLFVRSGSSDEKAPPNPEAFKLDVHPTASGAFASVSRAF